MVSKYFLTALVVSGSLLFSGADATLFARGGGGGGGHGGGGGGHGGYGGGGRGGYGGGGYGRGYGYGGGFYGGGLFYGDYSTGGGYPGYFAPYAYPNRQSLLLPSSIPVGPSYTPLISSYPPTGAAPSYFATPFAPRPAAIHVVLPDPQATVLFDGQKTSSTGGERLYNTPDLTPGESYHYKLRATWMQDGRQVTQEQTVAVTPGQTTEVVFSRATSESCRTPPDRRP